MFIEIIFGIWIFLIILSWLAYDSCGNPYDADDYSRKTMFYIVAVTILYCFFKKMVI